MDYLLMKKINKIEHYSKYIWIAWYDGTLYNID